MYNINTSFDAKEPLTISKLVASHRKALAMALLLALLLAQTGHLGCRTGEVMTQLYPCPLLDDTLDRNKLFGDAADRLFPEAVHGFTASSDSSLQINILGTDSPLVVKGVYFEKISAVGQSLTRYPADIAAIFESWEGVLLEKFATQLRGVSHSPTIFSITDFYCEIFRSRLKYPEI
jgi:hypothetical protein